MKKLSLIMYVILIVICTIFASCKEEKKDAPTIKFTYDGVIKNNGAEVDAKVGEEVTIIVEYNAPGSINQIFLRAENNHKVIIGEARASGFDKKTTHKISKTIKFEDSEDVHIKTSVEDKQKNALTTDFEMKVNVK